VIGRGVIRNHSITNYATIRIRIPKRKQRIEDAIPNTTTPEFGVAVFLYLRREEDDP
jgi:hypothetical protein